MEQVPKHKRLSEAGEKKGLPIGNLTSQFFANVYLNELDQFIKHRLKLRHYIRYVDDFVILGHTEAELHSIKLRIQCFLRVHLKLDLREPSILSPIKQGADFLGYIIRPNYSLVRRRVVVNLKERLSRFQKQFYLKPQNILQIQISSYLELRSNMASYWGHFNHASSYNLKQSLMIDFPWLMCVFDLSDSQVVESICLPDGAKFYGYRGQVNLMRESYPMASVRVQRGLEWDCFSPLVQVLDESLCFVNLVIVKELSERYRGGLKKRFVSMIRFNRSILCS